MDEFTQSLSAWVREWCDADQRKRNREESIRRLEREVVWMDKYIKTLRVKEQRKPSAIKEIRQYEHAKRRSEIELAFLYSEAANG